MTDRHRATVLLADDHPLLLKGLREIVEAEPDFVVVATAADGLTALTLARQLKPQIAMIDLAMPALGGLEMLQALANDELPTRVIILTALISDQQILQAIASGVWGIVLKESDPEVLADCLRSVASGRRQLPTELVERAFARRTRAAQQHQQLSAVLTAREWDVARLVSEGRPNSEIADALGLTSGTIRIHLHNIYVKLGVRNRTSLAALVLNEGGM